jgi:aminopeptidase-like protein
MDARIRDAESAAEASHDLGGEIHALASRLFPICRSLTGQGVRETLDVLAAHFPLERRRVASGTPLFDWTAPREWNVRDAFIVAPDGRKVVDFAASNLHVVGYSMPIRKRVSLAELKRHVHTLPDQPHLVPYRTAYYAPGWAFCMSHDLLTSLPEGDYEVCIDATLRDGWLDYGEYAHQGGTDREFLLSAHICHPSLANDNCSGLAVLAFVANALAGRATKHTYRFVLAPGTIGALAWLAANEDRVGRIDHGLIVSCVGDGGGPTYKQSRRGDAVIDRVMAHLLAHAGSNARVVPFSPYGYDERQYCSPGFDLPVGLLQNSAFGTFPEYHTSADDLTFIRPTYLERSFRLIMDAIHIVETDWTPQNLNPKGEPQLGRRGLYAALGGSSAGADAAMPMLWVLNLADGTRSLLAIAERSGLPFARIADAAAMLREHGLLREAATG